MPTTPNALVRPLLYVEDLVKHYRERVSLSGVEQRAAVDGVSFELSKGSTLGLVGQSGCGKSTLALCVACLERPTSGKIRLDGHEVTALSERQLRAIRPRVQLICQSAASAMSPRMTALEIVAEPLLIRGGTNKRDRSAIAADLFVRVGLSTAFARRHVSELSGGQRQRLAIARALILQPEVLILDESLSALDCSVQAQIANLLLDLQQSAALTCLFITHDFAMATHLADRIAVMSDGRIVESGRTADIVGNPQHEVTQKLIDAVPQLTPRSQDAVIESCTR